METVPVNRKLYDHLNNTNTTCTEGDEKVKK